MNKNNSIDLNSIQAGILKGHGRDYVALLLLKFKDKSTSDLRKILAKLPITSAQVQLDQTAQRKQDYQRISEPDIVTTFYLTVEGYKKIDEKWPNFKDDSSNAFKDGMINRDLGDPKSTEWEVYYQDDKSLHAMLSIACDDRTVIEHKVKAFKNNWKGIIKILHTQWGEKLLNDHTEPIEHFGYRDGISQPIFEIVTSKQTLKEKEKQHLWNPFAPLDLVLVQEPKTGAYGSYLVYRKLEQNVEAFKKAEKELALQLGFDEDTEELAGAMIVGRFENGLPIVRMGIHENTEVATKDNNFNYSLDVEGKRCPFHAHIRKVNPRGDAIRLLGMTEAEERSHHIVRRGIPYDEYGRNGDLSIYPNEKVGLLFLCFQSSIENQFEFMQKTWANNNDFPVPFTGVDPIIGQKRNRKNNRKEAAEQQWQSIDGHLKARSMSGFVHLKGGGYFFAPSLTFLKNLNI